jgi:hypothetical protein
VNARLQMARMLFIHRQRKFVLRRRLNLWDAEGERNSSGRWRCFVRFRSRHHSTHRLNEKGAEGARVFVYIPLPASEETKPLVQPMSAKEDWNVPSIKGCELSVLFTMQEFVAVTIVLFVGIVHRPVCISNKRFADRILFERKSRL